MIGKFAMSPSEQDPKALQILKAAGTILAREGYMGTTINLVAAEAGVSRGLLHYYFKNKEDMLARVLKQNMEISTQMISSIFEQEQTAKGYASAITGLLRVIMKTNPDFFHLFFEGYAVARHSDIVRQELSQMYGLFRKSLQGCLEASLIQNRISPRMSCEALAAIITGLIDGMGLQLLTEPDLCENQVIWDGIEKSIWDLLT